MEANSIIIILISGLIIFPIILLLAQSNNSISQWYGLKTQQADSFDISHSKKNIYELNVDSHLQRTTNITIKEEKSGFFPDLNKFAVGAEWIPNKFSIRNAWKKVAYWVGIKYEQTYHILNRHKINDFGISFGLELPIYCSNPTINTSAEFGKRSTKYNLARENYAKVNLSANLRDL